MDITRKLQISHLLQEALRRCCRQHMGKEGLNAALHWLEGFLRFQLEPLMETLGFTQHRGKQRLLHDITPLFELHLLHALACHVKERQDFRVTAQTMTTFYQHQSADVEFSCRRMLIQLISKLESVV